MAGAIYRGAASFYQSTHEIFKPEDMDAAKEWI
ncbi:hypothetical protein SAMN05444483_10188 [Salegentibacter echinorum]|uniref:Uncharacterized protein n=1 Tax=Salegentibacter echinorum TaxID=1073325 RepID=A0A1M5BLT7_SALEC|nr:hypothetical protein SAMN05444483_10188 [Salegentibacter echinorum]